MNRIAISALSAFLLATVPVVHAEDGGNRTPDSDSGVAAGTLHARQTTGIGEFTSDFLVGTVAALGIGGAVWAASNSDGTSGTSGTTGTTGTTGTH